MNLVAIVGGAIGIALMIYGLWRAIRDASSMGRTSSHALRVQLIGMGLFLEGSADPLGYLPLLNPLEVALIGVGALSFGLVGDTQSLKSLRRAWPLLALVFVTMATLRAVSHGRGLPWSPDLLHSGFIQASLSIVWSLAGVGAWILGSRRGSRPIWMGGAVLMAVVLVKLLIVDRSFMGNMPGIVSFMAVGLLLVAVGYIAPSPPRMQDPGESA